MTDAYAATLEAHWGGGAAPFGATWQKTMMWIFIVTDGLLFSGLVILGITYVRSLMGKTPAQGVEMAGLYWHFVDLVWVFIFTLFYLL